jgi:hypothetical protein
VEELSSNLFSMDVYPTPNNGSFTISFDATTKGNYKVEVINVLGEVISSDDLRNHIGSYRKQFNASEYGTGIYLIKLVDVDKHKLVGLNKTIVQ